MAEAHSLPKRDLPEYLTVDGTMTTYARVLTASTKCLIR